MPHPYLANARAIERSFLLGASPKEVERLITTPPLMAGWFSTRAENTPLGARLYFDKAGETETIDLFVDEPLGDETCAFRWESVHERYDSRFAFTLSDEDGLCRLYFREDGFGDGPAWDIAIAHQVAGWEGVLQKLAARVGKAPTRKIQVSGQLAASPRQVLKALTDVTELAAWFAPQIYFDARQGGAYQFTSPDFPGQGKGRVVVLSADRLALSWHGYPQPLAPTEVIFALVARDGGTWLAMEHSGWGGGSRWDAAIEATKTGWQQTFANLSRHLATVGASQA